MHTCIHANHIIFGWPTFLDNTFPDMVSFDVGLFWDQFGVSFESDSGQLGVSLEIILGSIWGHFGVSLGSIWGQFLEQFGDRIGVNLWNKLEV